MKTTKHTRAALSAVIVVLAMLLCMLPMGVSAAPENVPASDGIFTFTDSGITTTVTDSDAYKIEGTTLKIKAAGTYTITGSCAEGAIQVNKETTGVTLILDNLTLTSSTTAPLACNKSTDVTVYVTGTVTLNDNEDPATEDANEDYEGAAIKVKSGAALTITGSGTLNVNGNAKNGVKGAALSTVTVAGGTLNVNAENHGVASDNKVVISGGTLNITAKNEGLKASPDDDDADSAGDILISGGTLNINADDDAVNADGDLTVSGGSITISAGDDALHADGVLTIDGANTVINVTKSYEGFEGAQVYLKNGTGTVIASDDGVNAAADDNSVAVTIQIDGGKWYVNAGGDGLDAGGNSNMGNGTIVINGGVTEVYGSADNGNGALDSESGITHNGGTILAVGMSGMAETPSSGTYVAFGSAGMGGGMMGGFGGPRQGGFGEQPQGDFGGPQQGGFGGPQQGGFGDPQQGDFGEQPQGGFGGPQQGGFGGPRQNGFGNQQREQAPDFGNDPFGGMDQQQGNGSVSLSAGDAIVIKDSSGNTLYAATAVKSANSVVFASEALTSGETYSLYVNGSEAATATAATGSGFAAGNGVGGFPGGGQRPQNGQQPPQNGQQQTPNNQQQPQTSGDVPAEWAREEVGSAIDSGLVTENLQHNYQSEVTRGEVAQMFINLIEQASGEDINSFMAEKGMQIDRNAFRDTNDQAVLAANALGLINGRGNGVFDPNAALKRSEITAILNRAARLMGVDTAGYSHSFTDVTGHWVDSELGWAVQNGVINGRDAGVFDPEADVTTQEAIAITWRALNALK